MNRIVLVFSFLVCGTLSANAEGLFLFLPEIKGAATDKDHKDWIPILSFDAGFFRHLDTGAGGTTRGGSATASDIVVNFEESKASPSVLSALLTGRVFDDVKIHETATFDGNREVVARWELDKVRFTNFLSTAVESPASQSLAFAFEELEYTFIEFDEGGNKGGETSIRFNFAKGTSSNPFDPLELGDFDLNGSLETVDLDLLSVAVRNGSTGSRFDLNSDGAVDLSDRSFWIREIYGTLPGDTNLDREVGFSDFLILSSRFGQSAEWSGGDFNGDGEVAFADFLALSENFGQTRPAPSQLSSTLSVSPVPEPTFGIANLLPSLLCLTCYRRRRRGGA